MRAKPKPIAACARKPPTASTDRADRGIISLGKMVQQQQEGSREKGGGGRVWDCGSPLYDSFELASLCHVIDRHVMTLPTSCTGPPRLASSPPVEPSFPAGQVAVTGTSSTVMSREEEGRRLWKRRRGSAAKETDKGGNVMKPKLQRLLGRLPFWKKQ